jgi:cellulose synthase (UDP-forming)
MGQLVALRAATVLTVALGLNYVVWRWLGSVSWSAWWVAVPLALAETWTLVDTALFGAVAWRSRRRPPPPAAAPDLAVDVLVAADGQPADVVLRTADAALAVRYPHRTWVITDGSLPDLADAVRAAGAEHLDRPAQPAGRPRNPQADNLNAALLATEGDVLLVLDAGQLPAPEILDATLGYFADDRVALVETPQCVEGVPPGDPLGVLAPRWGSTLARGRDGWGAAFAGDAGALLRRDALMQLGLVGFVRETERSVRAALLSARRLVAQAQRTAPDRARAAVLQEVQDAAARALRALDAGEPLSDVTYTFQREVDATSASVVARDVAGIQADLAAIAALPSGRDDEAVVVDESTLARLADREWSPLGALASVQELVRAVDLGRPDEQPVTPVATTSVTEDLATLVRLHALGWRSVHHPDPLVRVAAPDDLRELTAGRLRRVQGTVQVLLREVRTGGMRPGALQPGQRLVRLAALSSSLSALAALVYLLVPVVVLCTGVQPVRAWDAALFLRLVPYLIAGQVLLAVASGGLRGWRWHQLGIVEFPWRVRALLTALSSVVTGRPVPTPAARPGAASWRVVAPQLVAMAALVVAAAVGITRAALGHVDRADTAVVLAWAAVDLVVLSAVLPGIRRRGVPARPARAVPAADPTSREDR